MPPLLRTCSHSGCATLTLGELCISHEEPLTRVFPRGRPFVPPQQTETAAPLVTVERRANGRRAVLERGRR